ncbi:hypothetical protein H3C70_01115 [Patescibacteria group bacterium]|nr:hypothetical protein [Patescibacteria group bacterium]
MKVWLFRIFAIVLMAFAGWGGWYWYTHIHNVFLLNPFANSFDETPPLSGLKSPDFLVYGFAPYWNLTKTVVQPELTHLAYFSLVITPEGDLDGISNEEAVDPDGDTGSRRWRSEQLNTVVSQLQPHQKLTVTLTQFDKTGIETFLTSPSAQAHFQEALRNFLNTTTRSVAGVNIDIEYPGEATDEVRQGYVTLVRNTRQTLDEYAQRARKEKLNLSISVYANAATRKLLWDLPALIQDVDHVVVMAYDFHRPSSPVAGPVAPLFGAKQNWDNDVVLHMKEFLELIPASKVLLGVPFYGYEWETTTGDARSLVFPGTGATASYSRVRRLLTSTESAEVADGLIVQGWDEDALSPYVIFTKDDRQHVIYYEDARSLGYKLQLVKELRLGGIAIWALGYEDGSRELWDAIANEL